MAGDGGAGGEGAERVAADHPVEVGGAERARGRAAGPDEELGADAEAVGDRRERDRLVGPERVAQRIEDGGGAAHQSRGSTYTWIVPPQVSPTANASSSE